MTQDSTIKVIVADDHAVVRQGIIKILATSNRIELLGEAESGDQAWLLIKDLNPDVALLDIRMPEMTGIEIITEINSAKLGTKSLILTNYDNPDYILEAISEGAHGYILKAIDPSSLIKSVIWYPILILVTKVSKSSDSMASSSWVCASGVIYGNSSWDDLGT